MTPDPHRPSPRRYHIRGILGRGAFGTVYRADQRGAGGFERKVALKVLNRDIATRTELASRLRDEARLLGMVHHRAIVHVAALVLLEGRWTVVMEFVPGADLSRLVDKGPLPPGPVLEIAAELAGALHAAVTCLGPDGTPLELQHRDLKPSNVLLTPFGEVKVVDFGVARGRLAAREARTGAMTFGTPGYVAPERLDLEESPAGDIYAVGCLLYELLAARPLGEGDTRTAAHTRLVQAALERLDPAIPVEVRRLLEALLAHDPDDRPTARELDRRARALRAVVDGPWLRDWAEVAVAALPDATLDVNHDFSSSIVSEQTEGRSGTPTLDQELDLPAARPDPDAVETWDAERPVPLDRTALAETVIDHPAPPPRPPGGVETAEPTTDERPHPRDPASEAPTQEIPLPALSPTPTSTSAPVSASAPVMVGSALVLVPLGMVLGGASVLLVWWALL